MNQYFVTFPNGVLRHFAQWKTGDPEEAIIKAFNGMGMGSLFRIRLPRFDHPLRIDGAYREIEQWNRNEGRWEIVHPNLEVDWDGKIVPKFP